MTQPTSPLPDLDSVDQIKRMVHCFYGDVRADDLLGPVFDDVAEVDWGTHLPKLTAFWARALLAMDGFKGNPFARHATIHAAHPLSAAHFDRWLELFERTLDREWAGPNAIRAKALAHRVARVHATQLGVDEP